jgi:hypothetical protein
MKKSVFMMVIALVLAMAVNAQTRVEVKSADVPKAISDKVAADYAGYAVQKAVKVTKNNQTTYDLIVLKGTDKERLSYNANGTFIKKVPVQVAQKGNGKAKQVAKAQESKNAAAKPAAPAAKPAATAAPAAKPAAKPAATATATQKAPEKK